MVPKWSCGPSGDGKSEINEVEMGLCVYASFWCANSELGWIILYSIIIQNF
uniref:Candidate secreted effector n=1 Tax=Meloidogyne incognita TaxID=6306 RepID=A0A914KXP2_MELIC